jgi:RNA polymerase sigma factor (sigma-70 family)
MTASVPAPAPLEALLRERAWVVALARHLAGDPHRGDDLAQEAFVAALEHPPRAGAVRGWFATVLRHGVSRGARGDERRVRRERTAVRAGSSASAAEAVERAEAHERVVRALLALDEPYRTALVLRFFEDLPPREIGRRTGVGAETARSRVHRGVALLRGRLGADDDPRSRRAAWLLVACPSSAGARPGPFRGAVAVGTKTKLSAVAALACVVISFVTFTLHETRAPGGSGANSIDGNDGAIARTDAERRARGGAGMSDDGAEAETDAPVVPRVPRPVHGVVLTAGGMPIGGARVTPINPASLLEPVPPDENVDDHLEAVRRRLRTMFNFELNEDDPDRPDSNGAVTTAPDGTFELDDVGSDGSALRATAPG